MLKCILHKDFLTLLRRSAEFLTKNLANLSQLLANHHIAHEDMSVGLVLNIVFELKNVEKKSKRDLYSNTNISHLFY